MIASDFKDEDNFPLKFEDNTTESDKKFFIKEYPKVDTVAREKIHCTTCDVHVGTAPISEKTIRTHPVLRVTHCNKCFAFYNSGEFGKGEDGSEFYCRWCGQGGEVFCCSSCPFVFCNKCIKGNLTTKYVKEIEENDDWKCFVCDKSILKKMRARHWALQNYVDKQSTKIRKMDGNEEEIDAMLNDDSTTCCPKKKKKTSIATKTVLTASLKRNLSSSPLLTPPYKKQNTGSIPIPKTASHNTYTNKAVKLPSKQPSPSKNNDEIVCTPDIMGLMSGNLSLTPSQKRLQVPPLVMRQQQERGRPRNAQPPSAHPIGKTAIFHNVNGFQIDLNQAARQEIFRLPNGKLIQVRKQVTPTTPISPGQRFPISNIAQSSNMMPRVTIRPNSMNRFQRPQTRPPQGPRIILPQQRFTVENRIASHQQQQPPPAPVPIVPLSTIFTQQNGSISVQRAAQPDTLLGKAKLEFEDKIISGMEVCQHTINKMITLSNSSSFKTSSSFQDIKGLYIHLQYLFTYTMGKYKSLQDSLTEGMETLAKLDPKLLDRDEEDIEILEEKTDCIEIESDDEESEPVKKSPAKIVTPPELTNGVVAQAKIPVPSFRHMRYIDKPKEMETETEPEPEVVLDVQAALDAPGIETVPVLKDVPSTSNSNEACAVTGKIKKCVVKLEKLEDSKSIYIKKYMAEFHSDRKISSRTSSVDTVKSIDSEEKNTVKSTEEVEKSTEEVEKSTEEVEKSTEEGEKSTEEVEKSIGSEEKEKPRVQRNKNGAGPKSSKKVDEMIEIDDDMIAVSELLAEKAKEDVTADENDKSTPQEVTSDEKEKSTPEIAADENEKSTEVSDEVIGDSEKTTSVDDTVTGYESELSCEVIDDSIEENKDKSSTVELECEENLLKEDQSKCDNAVEDTDESVKMVVDSDVNQVDNLESSQANKENEKLTEKAISESDLSSLLENLTDLPPNADGEFTV